MCILLLSVALLATGCFTADGRWRTFGPKGGGADLPYGLLLVQQTSPSGPSARCTFQFETPGGEFTGSLVVGNAVLFNLTPPFDRVRLVATGGAACLATQVGEHEGRRLIQDRAVGEVQNVGSLLNDECSAAGTWPAEPGSSLYGIVTANGDLLRDCQKFGLAPR